MKTKIFILLFFLLFSFNACSAKTTSAYTQQAAEDKQMNIADSKEDKVGQDTKDTPRRQDEPVSRKLWNKHIEDDLAASITSPASVGEWLESCRYSSTDQKYHAISFRISNIIQEDTDIRPVLDAYTSRYPELSFPPLQGVFLRYILLEYEVRFPDDFPETKEGILNADLIFNIVAPAQSPTEENTSDDNTETNKSLPDDESEDADKNLPNDEKTVSDENAESSTQGIIELDKRNYKILTNVYDVSESPFPNTLHPGDTYKGYAVFVLKYDIKSFLIRYSYYLDEEPIACYIQGAP